MQNVRSTQLKTCIFMTLSEFEDFIEKLTHGGVGVTYELDGLSFDFYDDEDWDATLEQNLDYLYVLISDFFGVSEVTSIHADDEDELGVWIVYKA